MNRFLVIFSFTALAVGLHAQQLSEFSMEPVDSMGSHHNSINATSVNADRITLRSLLGFTSGAGAMRVQGPGWLDDSYQVTAKARPGDEDHFLAALQNAIAAKLQLQIQHASHEMPVFVMRVLDANAPKLHDTSGPSSIHGQSGSVTIENAPMSDISNMLTRMFGRPVIDETSLAGRFSFELAWQSGNTESLKKKLRDQLGLTLTEDRRKIDVIQVDRK